MNDRLDWQHKGGVLDIPDRHFVYNVNFDADEPYITIVDAEDPHTEEKKMLVPKSLAYYLSTHACGSRKMMENFIEQGRHEVRVGFQRLLGL